MQTITVQQQIQELAMLAKRTADAMTRQGAVARLRRLSRTPLELGERREVNIGHVTMSVRERGIGRWYVEVRQFGEVLGAYSGTWRTEQDALRSFGSTLCLLANS